MGLAKTQDYCLTGINVAIKKGYFVRIMCGDVICWSGFLNLSKPTIYQSVHNGDGAAVCRKRWAAQSTSIVFDPFAVPLPKKKKTKDSTASDATPAS